MKKMQKFIKNLCIIIFGTNQKVFKYIGFFNDLGSNWI